MAVGLDLSAPMLEVAEQLAAQAGAVNARFVRGDAQAGPLRRNSFDVLISNFGVMFFDDPETAFANMAAMLRPHGRMAFLCWQDDNLNEVLAMPLRAFGASAPPSSATAELFVDPGKITDLLARTGWQDIQITPVVEPARVGADVDDVMGYVRGMPVMQGIADSLGDETEFERTLARVADDYAPRQYPDGVWVNAAAWLVTARRA